MEIKEICLTNVGGFESLSMSLAPTDENSSNITVLVGNNGAGKTTILKSLATALSWWVARLRSEKGNGNPLPEEVIRNNALSALVDIKLQDDNWFAPTGQVDADESLFQWSIAKIRKGRKSGHSSHLIDASRLAELYRQALSTNERSNLPLIAFYPVERVVIDIPLKIRDKHSFLQLDGYDNSLNQGVDFRRFFEWFREREDSENESGISQEIFEKLSSLLANDNVIWEKLSYLKASARDRQLTAVRTAISSFMPGFNNLRVRRKPRLHMSVDKNGETLNVAQLSQGEKSLIALVGDIARRLAMMNPSLENPLHGDGIILIDEVDLHLHPQWQRALISRLANTFPNCQFVLTTHSPLVISDPKEVLVYLLNDGDLSEVFDLYGQDANSVLLEVMDTDIRNKDVEKALNDLRDAVQAERIDDANRLMSELEIVLPASHIELAKARLLLTKVELRRAQNHQRK
ncbi:AAA family ATPase [Stutzerimonas stutzeri]|uniref:ATP-binding protein n=1 Tax=Stutzerimonas stutzeri TaxID=316 RepID=A0A0D7E3Z8_STUST|nr:AAA family ATPase [Stutzerimonas stutzeri]KIZ35609.1 ATP-binding protein [Stutzerimonas stutzeri]